MKKAKILVPAMGMMLLSTAAAVSGTMAWFSANRAVEVRTTQFAVEALDGALSVEGAALCGTTADNSTNVPQIGLDTNVKLADASFNHATGKLYTDVADDEGTVTAYEEVGDLALLTGSNTTAWAVNSTTTYYAVAFKLTFTYEFKGDTNARHLFFDEINSSTIASGKQDNSDYTASDKLQTRRGFRIALVAGSEQLVWAPQRSAADTYYKDAEHPSETVLYKYVTGTSLENVGTYDVTKTNAHNLVCSQATNNCLAAATDNPAADTDHTDRPDYLGTLTNVTPGTTNKLEVKCVAWFEGMDPEVVNDATMDKISSSLKFYIRTAHHA